MQEILYTIVLSLGSIITMFLLTKLIGYRQMSQLSMFDYINGITIGSIAAEMSTSLDDNFMQPLTAMIVYALSGIFLSIISSKSMKSRRFIEGTPIVLLNNGTLYEKNFKKAKLDISEFLQQCRVNGYFDISDLQTAILEPNGQISFLPLSTARPINPEDMGITPSQDTMTSTLIIDGKIMSENLKHSGKDEKWLQKQLATKNIKKVTDVFLATCDLENQLTVFEKNSKESGDILD
jgi:uncharacterized membrane protein YcaP (DUF421 family)